MRWLVLALITLQAATCGQKGPLTLPEQPAGIAATARPALTHPGTLPNPGV